MTKIYIWVEGDDDQRFFQEVIQPYFEKNFSVVHVRQYSQLKKTKRRAFIEGIIELNDDYLIVGDIDSFPCVISRKDDLIEQFGCANINPGIIDDKKLIVLIREIESWYLAGLDDEKSEKLGIGIGTLGDTNNINRAHFDAIIPRQFKSRIDFMRELLKIFSFDVAKEKNRSFNYFATKYNSYLSSH